MMRLGEDYHHHHHHHSQQQQQQPPPCGACPASGQQTSSSRGSPSWCGSSTPTWGLGVVVRTLLVLCILLTALQPVLAKDDPPLFVEQPKDQKVVSGRVASFTCRATGNPEPRIEWRKNSRRLAASHARYMILDVPGGSILRIEPVKFLKDDTKYECVAENAAGDTITAEARLFVYSDDANVPKGFPKFRTEPKTKAVEIDHTALLVCDAHGKPDPTITWYKDHKPVDLNNSRYTVLRSGSLQISTSTEEDGGKYECVAENDVGTAFSDLVNLYVRVRRVAPRFSKILPEVIEVLPGESRNLTCVAIGSPMPYVQWKKGPAQEMTDNVIGKNVLVLENIQESGNFTCQAQSTLGLVTHDVQVKVQALPRPPTNVRVSDITATSVRITWSYDVSPNDVSYYVIQYKPRMADRDYAEISGLVTKFYSVSGLTPFTEYEFHVLAVNKIGRGPPSEPAFVTTGETEPGSAPRNVQVRPLSSSTMVIQWDEPETPNGQVTGYKLYYTTNPSLPTQAWKSQPVQDNKLTTISDLTPHTIYTIKVQAYTGIGPGPYSEPVKVKTQQGVPSQPTNLRPTRVTATAIELSWTRPSHQGENIISYELYWNDSYTQKQDQRTIPVGESYTLTGLHPNTVYHMWLAAKSQRGEGAATPSISVRTEQHTPGAPPQDIKAVAEDSQSIRVEWKPPPEDKQNGDITYYKLMYVNNSRPDMDAAIINVPDPNKRDYEITGLQKWTEYRVWMLAGTVMGNGVKSEPILVRTDEDGQEEEGEEKEEVVRTWTSLREKYDSIYVQAVQHFIGVCQQCLEERKQEEASHFTPTTIVSDLNRRGQVDVVDTQSYGNMSFGYVMHYQDLQTKLNFLRPLGSRGASAVAQELLLIFLDIGPPRVLQSSNGRGFTAEVIHELSSHWPQLILVNGRPKGLQDQELVERVNSALKNEITTWVQDHGVASGLNFLRFVQWQMNTRVRKATQVVPYEAMFGKKPVLGFSSSASVSGLGGIVTGITEEMLSGMLSSGNATEKGTEGDPSQTREEQEKTLQHTEG